MNQAWTDRFDGLISWVEDIKQKNGSSAAGLYILKDSQVVLEHYSGNHSHEKDAPPTTARSQFNVASARKSYLGLAVAYALHDKCISGMDDPILRYFPEYDRPLYEGTTIRHLVTHSHGLASNMDGVIFREFKAGTNWAYRNVGVDILISLIHRLYGKGFPQLLDERVFTPMGFSETGWRTESNEHLVPIIDRKDEPPLSGLEKNSDGSEKNLFVSAREFARWGQLHLQHGKMGERQIVPPEVIKLATSIQHSPYTDPSLPANGMFWYIQDIPRDKSELGEIVPAGSYQILGDTGPTILVIPAYKVVVAKMYNKRYNYGGEHYLKYLREFSNQVCDLFS
ncbi:beta-lactamase family protein (plasmid) [Cytobacillus spongiae]|nr:serine hydrolase domain-containing protein [Cytobacillus spongiae]UII58318.1 beta-lactamase family protein [Cytobacillus spongiae]